MPTREPLDEGEVHLWLAEPESIEPRVLDCCEALLDSQERIRHQRLKFDWNQREFAVSHALLRMTLARYAPVAAMDWQFQTNAYDRPEVAHAEHAWLRFNLSHVRDLVVVGVTRAADLGVDVEDSRRRVDMDEIARHYFMPEEAQAFARCPPAQQRDLFYRFWTLKEAYIKARGMGLTIPLDQFGFQIQKGKSPQVFFDSRLGDDERQWQFRSYSPTPYHRLSIALRSRQPLSVRIETAPLASLMAQ